MVLACFLGPSGLSRAAREYFKAFSARSFRVIPVWLSEPTPEGVDAGLAERMLSAAGRPMDSESIELYVGLPHALRTAKNAKAVLGSCVFENFALTSAQIGACRKMDAILVPSTFCYRSCVSSGLDRRRVFYLPYPLDSDTWNGHVRPSVAPSGRFRFLYMNSLYHRKGYDVLLRAWWKEFGQDDPVELYVKSYREDDRPLPVEAHIDAVAKDARADRSKEAPIRIVDKVMDDAELPAFMASFDCYVSPHRSEGFGMNPWHAMALGVPVVCTDYGGVTDFAKEDTAWLVPSEGMVPPSSEELRIFPHLRGTRWAEPSEEGLRRQMRACMSSPDEARLKATKGGRFVHRQYAPDRVVRMFEKIVERASPGAWEELNWSRKMEKMANQPGPRYEPGKSLRLAEI